MKTILLCVLVWWPFFIYVFIFKTAPLCLSISCRLVELAPQYYLGNLPSSEGRDFLMELRQSLLPPDDPEEGDDAEGAKGRGEGASDPRNQYSTEMCLIQWWPSTTPGLHCSAFWGKKMKPSQPVLHAPVEDFFEKFLKKDIVLKPPPLSVKPSGFYNRIFKKNTLLQK